jgi:glycosyltransferase involved in cell wall biosynthesis
MARIVTVTPISVQRDSRTLKQATSIARFGYHSLVIEAVASQIDREKLKFALDSPPQVLSDTTPAATVATRPVRKSGVKAWIKRWLIRLNIYQLLTLTIFFWQSIGIKYGFHTLKRTPKAALYYLHAPHQFIPIYLLSRRYRVPYIYDAHDFYSRIENDGEVEWIRRNGWLRIQRWLEKRSVKHAADVVTVSQGIAGLMFEAFGIRPLVIRNCHDERFEKAIEPGLRAKLELAEETALVIVIGQWKKGQAINEALAALARLPPHVHLAMLGRGYEQFQSEAVRLGVSARVHMVQPVLPTEVVPFVRSADASLILYYPRSQNYLHALPNGFFQSVAAGLPLLYPPLPEIRRLAQQYKLGIEIEPTSAESIRESILKLIESPERMRRYRNNAKIASQELSWEREEQILKQLIERVLDDSDAKRNV